MKTIEVVAAVIRRADGKIFATQRGYGEFKDKWEFPGGKIEKGETPEEALKREIKEELDTEIEVDNFITTVETDYEHFHLTMHCYFCHVLSGHLSLLEAENAVRTISSLLTGCPLIKRLSRRSDDTREMVCHQISDRAKSSGDLVHRK